MRSLLLFFVPLPFLSCRILNWMIRQRDPIVSFTAAICHVRTSDNSSPSRSFRFLSLQSICEEPYYCLRNNSFLPYTAATLNKIESLTQSVNSSWYMQYLFEHALSLALFGLIADIFWAVGFILSCRYFYYIWRVSCLLYNPLTSSHINSGSHTLSCLILD